MCIVCPRNNVPLLPALTQFRSCALIYPEHLNKSLRHCKLACLAGWEVGGIMLFNQIFGLTNPGGNGIVPGSVFFLRFNKVQLWN